MVEGGVPRYAPLPSFNLVPFGKWRHPRGREHCRGAQCNCNPPIIRAINSNYCTSSLLMNLLDGQHRLNFSRFLNTGSTPDYDNETIETVVRTQRHRLDADKFPIFSVGWTWQGFCRDLDPCLSE